MQKFSEETQEIIDRLNNFQKTDKLNPTIDKNIIEEAFKEHFDLLGLPCLSFKYFDNLSAAESAAWSAAESAAWSVAWSAAWSVAWSAAWLNSDNLISQKYGYIWLPFLKAYEKGLWFFWITEKEILICLRPSLSIKNDKLHNENGPAVFWPNEEYYFLNGVKMDKNHVITPANNLNPKDILKEKNVEVRRELIRKIGMERLLNILPSTLLDKKDNYKLYNIQLSDDVKNARYLKMTNPSINCFHLEGVEGDTVQEALNFRAQNIKNKLKNINWQPSQLT